MDMTARQGVTRKERGPGSRSALALLCAFAVLFQLLFIQTHVHPLASLEQVAGVSDVVTLATGEAPAKSKPPADGARTECFICQSMALAGAAILPDVAEPVVIEHAAAAQPAPVAVAMARPPTSHAWRSRGPPDQI